MNKSRLWLVALIALLFLANFVFVPNVNSKKVIGSDVVNLSPIADSYVNQSSLDVNYGGDTSLRIECNSYHLYSYIKFDLSSLPSGASIIDAKLWLTLTSISGYGSWGVTIGAHYCSDDSWNEASITWNNKPSFASDRTDANGFWYVFLPSTDSWNVTVDAQTALGSDKKLTEAMIFEEPSTDYGWASFRSREVSGVRLEIEYTTKPIYTVEFASIQDTGNTANVGNLNFSSSVFAFPNSAVVAEGNYEAEYDGGYTFLRWETEGGVNALNPNVQKTNVAVTGSGKLRAVGSADVIRYFYDDSGNEGYTFESAGEMVAVRFTPLFLGTLKKARFYIAQLSYSPPNSFKVHVMDENRNDVITPFSQVATSTGWLEVDLSAYNVDVRKDFYIGVEWPSNYYPCIGEDTSSPNDRSFSWNGTAWLTMTGYDYMIRATVESKMPLKQVGIITCTPASTYVYGGRNIISGAITPVRVGVEVNLTYIRPDSSTVMRKIFTNATGGYTDSFTPDKVGLWKVMASWAGDETYEGSASYPEEFTVSNSSSYLSLSVTPYSPTIDVGSSVNLTGNISPERFATIDLQYTLNQGQTWVTFASVNTTEDGSYSYKWTPQQAGNYRVRASWKGDELSSSDTSYESSVNVQEPQAIPEFPSAVLPLFMVFTAFAIILQKTKKNR